METDGPPPHCIIYKYGFLHVSITLHRWCAQAQLFVRVCVYDVCMRVFCTDANTFFPLSLNLRPDVPSVCDCVCVCYTVHTLHVFQVGFFFYSPVCRWKFYLLLINLLFHSLSELILLTFQECSTFKSSCCISLFTFSWATRLSSLLVANICKFHFSKTNRRSVK